MQPNASIPTLAAPRKAPAPATVQWRRRPPPGVAARWKGTSRLAIPAS